MNYELKKQRFLFLEKLYEVSKADPDRHFPTRMIGYMIGLDPWASIDGIVKYLEKEGLIQRQLDVGRESQAVWIPPVSITHKGIKEIQGRRTILKHLHSTLLLK